MDKTAADEIDVCIESMVSVIDTNDPCYNTFCKKCVGALTKQGFGIDVELLQTALKLSSEEHFELTGTLQTREREMYCFRKIRKAFRPFTFQSVT
jgi:hypothetical protein